jgi:hypothetical protein
MSTVMPPAVGICFSHAALQVLAEDNGVDLLHIKGPAVDETLLDRLNTDAETGRAVVQPVPRSSVDADVLVRPSHLDVLLDALRRHGWSMKYRFEDGSPFEHAATMEHPFLAPVDLHRRFPGIGLLPEAAFERLWVDRHAAPVAGYPCTVPSISAQRLLLLLAAARGVVAGNSDVRRSWLEATDDERRSVEALAVDLRAQVALAAASGRLDEFRDSREHALWAALSRGEASMLKLWAARVRAAPDLREALRTAVKLVLPNPHRLAQALGRPPTRRELADAYLSRASWGLREVLRAAGVGRPRARP